MQIPHPPLTDFGRELLDATTRAHSNSCERNNVSSQTVINTTIGSGDYLKAIAGAVLTLGGVHGPIEKTFNLLRNDNPTPSVLLCIEKGWRVPGWGNSFEKGHPDPHWAEVERILFTNGEWANKFNSITETLHNAGKNIYPNPSAYTAACAIVIGLPANIAAYILISGRLAGWTVIASGCLNGISAKH